MRGRSLLWIAVIQVAASLGTVLSPASADPHTQPTAMQIVCRRVQEPSATALRMIVEQTKLQASAPGVPWAMLLTLLGLPINILLWHALWRVISGDGLVSERERDWSSRTLRREAQAMPAPGHASQKLSFPSSMSAPRR